MRRRAPVVLVALGLVVLLTSYVLYTQRVVSELRGEAARTSRMFARVFGALADTSAEAGTAALFDLSREIRDLGVPVVLTDEAGSVTAVANLPFEAAPGDPRVRAYLRKLDRENPPVVEPGIGVVHYGSTPLVRGLRVIPALQAGIIALLIIVGAGALRTRSRADREHVWAGMARESAHQLGTPLSSLKGWLELLHERENDPLVAGALAHMEGDAERLERVAHRFERIGRPPKRDPVDLSVLARHVVDYFALRAPTLARTVQVTCELGDGPFTVPGDRVLLEWAVESLVKNSIDALADAGGKVVVSVDRAAGGGARIRVADDGPGIPKSLRRRIFAAGFSTKERGWGIGLPLSKRIVEENHGGKLVLVPSPSGAVFDVILPG